MVNPAELERKRELILQSEMFFANRLGSAVFEKPTVSMWMVLVPILFLYFVYRMQKYKNGRVKFDQDFMITRRRAMEIAVEAVKKGAKPDIDSVVRQSQLLEPLVNPYAEWVQVLTDYYIDLLSARGSSFESLVRSAYGNSSNYLLALNRLSMAEKRFYAALKPHLAQAEGAADIIAAMEQRSHLLRRELADSVFD